jgi:Fe-S cluster biosynthesis and repair protein YggX
VISLFQERRWYCERGYAYGIIQKAYWINEKKIEMLDYKKRNKLLENYYKYITKGE